MCIRDREILPFVVDHYPVNSAFGFKISYKGRTVVISGDTIHDGSVQKYSKDVDLLVHSAISIDIVERITVISAGKYEAEVITGAKIKIENGLIIPPVRKSKKPSCNVSNNK